MTTYAELAEELARQRERADLAETRLDLARQALVADGYFTRAEVGEWDQPDIAPRITELAVHLRNQIEAAETEIAALHEGEEPYGDESLVPTPAQWIWQWNRAKPEDRLAVAKSIRAMCDQLGRVETLARDWHDASPLIPGQALADLRNALSDNPQSIYVQNVQAGGHLIRVPGDRTPTPAERRAIGALLDATEEALTRESPPATGGIYSALHKAVAETVTAPVVGETVDCGPQSLTVRYMTPAPPRCESGLHYRHPGMDCDEQEQWQTDFSAFMQEMMRTNLRASPFGLTATPNIPPALRGPNCPRPPEDPAPLRKLAEQALADGGPLPGVRLAADIFADTDLHGGRIPTGISRTADTGPQPRGATGLYELMLTMFGAPLPRPSNTSPDTCAATWTTGTLGIIRCSQPVGHYDDDGQGGKDHTHLGQFRGAAGDDRTAEWTDGDKGATPHRQESTP